ncbi:MAG: UDP-N-acetylmuramate--L-alanine ligase [Bacteroidetes bacterium]|nr:UDP-N-acetylmuramate--L-alanine ligase [Bacteroidota bacterium]
MKEIHEILNNKDLQVIYFIGIGGIGMSALARYFKSQGKIVAGYDRAETPLTKTLQDEGMHIHYQQDEIKNIQHIGLVIYTPAVPADSPIFTYCLSNSLPLFKRSDVLQGITKNGFNICIAGTHGKTTISTLTAHILRDSGYGCNAFLGGISVNYQTNFWHNENHVFVIEADEYDRSFLKLSPDMAVITAMDADHLDIYGTANEVENAFIAFSGKIKLNGSLVFPNHLKRQNDLHASNKFTYGIQSASSDTSAENIRVGEHAFHFDVHFRSEWLKDLQLNMGGRHNIENTLAAITIAKQLCIDNEKIKSAIQSFKGVKRRFEFILNSQDHIFIDDYAHHPEELRALISGVKELYPTKKCLIIFQPHLYSRTKDLAMDFAKALDQADEVILLPLYPAREKPIEGVSSELILTKMNLTFKSLMDKKQLLEYVENKSPELLVTAGAGDIDMMLPSIKQALIQKRKLR